MDASDETALRVGLEEALAFHRAGRLQEAQSCYAALLEKWPKHPDVIELFGVLQHQLGHTEAACALLRTAIQHAPQIAFYHNNLGEALRAAGDFDAAANAYREALRLDPHLVEAQNNLGLALQEVGDAAGAVQCFEAALEQSPLPLIYDNLGHAWRDLGQREQAQAAYRSALALEPDRAESWRALFLTRRFKSPNDPDILKVFELLQAETRPEAKLHLHFALAQALDECGAYAQAFEQAQAAHEIERAQRVFSSQAHREQVSELIQKTPEELLYRGRLEASRCPILIVGAPRSGSSLLEQMLTCHPQIGSVGECSVLDRLAQTVPVDADAPALAKAAQSYLHALQRYAHTPYVIDKMPGNAFHLGLLARMIPRARVIWMRRDPMDCGLSIYMTYFARGQAFASDLGDIASWLQDVDRAMEHWKSASPLQILDVHYEDLVRHCEETLRSVFDFLEVEWCEASLKFTENPNVMRTASAFQVRRSLYTSSIGRARAYGDLLAPLKASIGHT